MLKIALHNRITCTYTQTVSALEQEFRDRATRMAQAKQVMGEDGASAHALQAKTDDAAVKSVLGKLNLTVNTTPY